MAELWCEMVVAIMGMIVLSFGRSGIAGKTSTFVRSEWPSLDIPPDNQAFAIPKGRNAPQQVSSSSASGSSMENGIYFILFYFVGGFRCISPREIMMARL